MYVLGIIFKCMSQTRLAICVDWSRTNLSQLRGCSSARRWKEHAERIIAFWLVTSCRPRTAQLVSSPFMIDKCPLCLGCNCKAAEYMTTASVCLLQNGIFCPWQQGHTFVWLFGGEGCTPPPPACLLTLKWTFCLCVFNVSRKTAGTETRAIVPWNSSSNCLYVCLYMCSWAVSPQMNTVWLKMCLDLGKFGSGSAAADIWKCKECQLFMLALGMWSSGIKDVLKQITSKYWHQADCLVYYLNFSVSHFLLQHGPSDGRLAYIFLNCQKAGLLTFC